MGHTVLASDTEFGYDVHSMRYHHANPGADVSISHLFLWISILLYISSTVTHFVSDERQPPMVIYRPPQKKVISTLAQAKINVREW